MNCPECGESCWRECADIGVSILYGPYGCESCGWSEWSEYNQRDPNHKPFTDQFGGVWPGLARKESLDAEEAQG